ncbi:23S ribosomal RNA methyltransferase Erm, partial [Rhodococcus hoagii]|nr:23S ribosomal RNA methyltransferase Erm [Prescottella equi]
MPTYRSGRHELGQNFLTDRKAVDTIVDLVSRTDGPIIEIGSGGGALTLPLQALRRPITAIEIDPRHVQKLQHRVDPSTTVVHGDFLRYRLPRTPHTIVGNLPFHHTTAMLRRILHA